MKKMKNNSKFLILSLVLVLFSTSDLQAQRKNRVIQKADQAFDAEMYFEAAELYKKGYNKTTGFSYSYLVNLDGNKILNDDYYIIDLSLNNLIHDNIISSLLC